MFRSLRAKLTLALLSVAIITVAVIGYLFKNVAAMQFQVYLEQAPLWGRSLFFPRTIPPVRALIGLAEEQYLAALRTSLWQAGLSVAVVAGVVGLFLAHRLSQPLNELTKAATEIAAQRPGELRDLAPRPRVGQGEVERLSRAFYAMAQSLDEEEIKRRQFLADVTHELRTPLTIVQGRLEAILDGVIDPTPEEIAALHTQALLLGRLTQDLEMLALAQAKALTLDLHPADPVTLASDVLQAHVIVAQREKINLKLDIADRLPELITDTQRLTQVLHNLITNALRHSRPGGTVTLRVERLTPDVGTHADAAHGLEQVLEKNAEGIGFSVIDTGEGIPPHAISSLFEPFTRVDPSRNRSSGGSGLGLAIVRYLVEAHNGAVWIRSTHGQGTAITVWLPTAVESEAPASAVV